MDIPCAPILADITVEGRRIKAIAQPTKQGWLYVFDRTNGKPVWPIEERPVAKGDVPGEWYSPKQPFVTRPPELKAEAEKAVARYKIGPIFTAPTVSSWPSPLGTLVRPGSTGGANWPGG